MLRIQEMADVQSQAGRPLEARRKAAVLVADSPTWTLQLPAFISKSDNLQELEHDVGQIGVSPHLTLTHSGD